MAAAKNQMIENNEVNKTENRLGKGEKDEGKMKGLPNIFMKTNEMQDWLGAILPRTHDV